MSITAVVVRCQQQTNKKPTKNNTPAVPLVVAKRIKNDFRPSFFVIMSRVFYFPFPHFFSFCRLRASKSRMSASPVQSSPPCPFFFVFFFFKTKKKRPEKIIKKNEDFFPRPFFFSFSSGEETAAQHVRQPRAAAAAAGAEAPTRLIDDFNPSRVDSLDSREMEI